MMNENLNEKSYYFFDWSPLSRLMDRAFSLRARGATARPSSTRRGRDERLLLSPLGVVPSAFVELPLHLQQPMLELASSSSSTSTTSTSSTRLQQQQPVLELASSSSSTSTSTSTSTPTTALGAAVSAATDLLFSTSPASSAPPLAEAAQEEDFERDGAGVATPLAVAAAIEKDFANSYFVTGKITGEVYSRAAVFADPTVTVEGLSAWRRNIALLGKYLDNPRIELIGRVAVVGADEGLDAEGDFARGDALASSAAAASSQSSGSSSSSSSNSSSSSSENNTSAAEAGDGSEQQRRTTTAEEEKERKHAVVARWRLVAPVSLLPWRPVVDVQGVTVYRLAGEEGGEERREGEEAKKSSRTKEEQQREKSSEGEGASSSSLSPSPRVVVVLHTEAWGTSPWAAVAQLLVPGGRGGGM